MISADGGGVSVETLCFKCVNKDHKDRARFMPPPPEKQSLWADEATMTKKKK